MAGDILLWAELRTSDQDAADGLHPSSKGVRVRFSGATRTVTDGPFAETKELVAGFWLWKCKSLQEAIDWVKRCPNPMPGESEIEIRQVVEAEDLKCFMVDAKDPQGSQEHRGNGPDCAQGHDRSVPHQGNRRTAQE